MAREKKGNRPERSWDWKNRLKPPFKTKRERKKTDSSWRKGKGRRNKNCQKKKGNSHFWGGCGFSEGKERQENSCGGGKKNPT